MFPRWVPLGCGTAAGIFLLIGFVGGPLALHSGVLGKAMAFSVDMSAAELAPMIGKDVPPAQRQAFNVEMAQLSRNLEAERTNLTRVQPVLNGMKDALADKKVTAAELANLTKLAHDANQPAPPKRAAHDR